MELKVSAFDWDDGNRDKCRKHGLSMSDVEHVLVSAREISSFAMFKTRYWKNPCWTFQFCGLHSAGG
jgi:hypothetical protein